MGPGIRLAILRRIPRLPRSEWVAVVAVRSRTGACSGSPEEAQVQASVVAPPLAAW